MRTCTKTFYYFLSWVSIVIFYNMDIVYMHMYAQAQQNKNCFGLGNLKDSLRKVANCTQQRK